MLKLQIENLSDEWDIEVKQEAGQYRLIVIRSKFKDLRSDPKAWYGQTKDETSMVKIEKFLLASVENPHQPRRITINDGTRFTVRYAADGKELQLVLSNFDRNTNEYNLVEQIFDLCIQLISDSSLDLLKEDWEKRISD